MKRLKSFIKQVKDIWQCIVEIDEVKLRLEWETKFKEKNDGD